MDNSKEFKIVGYSLEKYNGTSENVIIPEGVKQIGLDAFRNCTFLKSIIIPDGVIRIRHNAFSGCRSLVKITLPDSLKEIQGGAFEYCSSLQSIELPPNLKEIGSHAFKGCTSLADENGMLIVGNILFDYLGNSTSLTIPYGVTRIEYFYFNQNSALLKHISVPDTVNEIYYDRSFLNNNALKSFVLRTSHPKGGEIPFGERIKDAFLAASQLCLKKDSDYPEAVKKGLLNKKDLRKISLIRLSASEDEPDKKHFEFFMDILKRNRLVLLEEAIYDKDYDTIGKLLALDLLDISAVSKTASKVAESNKINDPELTAFALDLTEKLFGADKTQTYIENKMDRETALSESLKPSQPKRPDPNSVSELRKLWKYVDNRDGTLTIQSYLGSEKEIQIPSTIGKKKVISIAIKDPYFSNVFTSNPSPVRITIPEGVTLIGKGSFRLLYDLKNVSIPESVTEIGECAFEACASLKEIHIPKRVKSIYQGTFYNCKSMESVFLPNKVKLIESQAFYNCSSLKSIELPGNIKEIGDFAFIQCGSLKSIVIPESVKTIGSNSPAFDTCVTIIGKRGSSAEQYASRFGNPFQEL